MRKFANEKPPLRSELFSTDQMAQYGKALAGRQQLIIGRAPNQLLKRLADNEEMLDEVQGLSSFFCRRAPEGDWTRALP